MDNDQTKLLKDISAFLSVNKITYMVTGAWSVIFYGLPRASHDIDFVIELHKADLSRIINVFGKLPGEFLIELDSITEAVNNKSMFQVLHLPTMLKFDFWLLTDEEFDKSRFKRRQRVKVLDQIMEMASKEDTIIQKLRWYKEGKIEKHLIDAAFVYQIQKENLDKKYLNFWVKKLGLENNYLKLGEINLEEYI